MVDLKKKLLKLGKALKSFQERAQVILNLSYLLSVESPLQLSMIWKMVLEQPGAIQ